MSPAKRRSVPFFSSRLPLEYLDALDDLAKWLHETRGLRRSRRVAIEYLIDLWRYGERPSS